MNISKEFLVEDICSVLFGDEKVSIDDESASRVNAAFDFLKNFSNEKIIYGINTGFGPMTQYKINAQKLRDLQYNLIRSHASGCSSPLPELYVKAAMLARVKSLSQGRSGVHIDAVKLLADLINHNVYPYIPEHGSVGASGDLVQLAHIALVLIGEGEVFYKGSLRPAKEVFAELKLTPLTVKIREGLALINGTSVMTGIALVNLVYARRLASWMVTASAMVSEIIASFDDYYSEELNIVKRHEGQRFIAACLRNILSTSELVKKRPEHLYEKKVEKDVFDEKIQEYYSIRCTPQVIGAIWDAIVNAEKVVYNEFESVSDNPIVDAEHGNVYHGGNFHGDYISFEMDKLKIAVTKLSMLSERQLNFLLNNKLNCKLPPFVNLGTLGLNLGMQGVQFTAVSTTAENQTLSFPMYVHSISNNNDNQDIVSMGTNSALLAKKVIENAYEVLAIEFMTLIQAIDYLKNSKKMSSHTRGVYDRLRAIVPVFVEDTPKYRDIEKMKNHMMTSAPEMHAREVK